MISIYYCKFKYITKDFQVERKCHNPWPIKARSYYLHKGEILIHIDTRQHFPGFICDVERAFVSKQRHVSSYYFRQVPLSSLSIFRKCCISIVV
uniref:Uncharacterized protein n=1 Tax=Arundo donax TaxID=35708 RepID=A0A0A9G9C4_ARUDO